MKTLIMLLFAVAVSCNQNKKQENSTAKMEVNAESDKRIIYGFWNMCATSDKETMTQMNTCKEVAFNKDGTGNVKFNGSITENFVWTLNEPSMKIIYRDKAPGVNFPDTFYYASFTKADKRINLSLRHNDNSFYLTK